MSLKQDKVQKEILATLSPNPHGILDLSPRIGKTKLTIDILKRDTPESILWVTPFTSLKKDILKEFITWKAEDLLPNLIISSYASLKKIKGYKATIVLDEYQYITESNLKNILTKELQYLNIIALSGTKTKAREKKSLLKQLGLDILYSYGLVKAVKKGVLSKFNLNIVQIYASEQHIKEVLKWQKIIDKSVVGGYEVGPEGFKSFGELELNLSLVEKVVPEEHRMFSLRNKDNRSLGYLIRREDSSHQGKIVLEESVYYLKNRVVSRPINKFVYISRAKAIGGSLAKTEICKRILQTLSEQRNLIFCNSIKQSSEVCSHTFNGKTKDGDLIKFMNKEITSIAMVNKGGIGSTYKEIDNLILIQVDSDTNGGTSQKLARTMLKQINYKANIWILCLMNSQDEVWVKDIVDSLEQKNVKYIPYEI